MLTPIKIWNNGISAMCFQNQPTGQFYQIRSSWNFLESEQKNVFIEVDTVNWEIYIIRNSENKANKPGTRF